MQTQTTQEPFDQEVARFWAAIRRHHSKHSEEFFVRAAQVVAEYDQQSPVEEKRWWQRAWSVVLEVVDKEKDWRKPEVIAAASELEAAKAKLSRLEGEIREAREDVCRLQAGHQWMRWEHPLGPNRGYRVRRCKLCGRKEIQDSTD